MCRHNNDIWSNIEFNVVMSVGCYGLRFMELLKEFNFAFASPNRASWGVYKFLLHGRVQSCLCSSQGRQQLVAVLVQIHSRVQSCFCS